MDINLDSESYYILLDACRYDTFKEVINEFSIDGKLEKGKSVGNNTTEFYNNIKNQHDMVVITANSHPMKIRSKFKKVYLTRDIIPNNNITEFMHVYNSYPKYRYLLHIVQPHIPWMTGKGKELYDKYVNSNNIPSSINRNDRWFGPMGIESLVYKHYGREESLKHYKDNLRYALKSIEDNLDKLPLRFIIISDHGNMFGEHDKWGHTDISFPYEELRDVPWYIIDRS